MANKCFILYIPEKEGNTLVGIFDKYDKAYRYVKKDFYCGSIPRDESEFSNSTSTKKHDNITEIKGTGIPHYIIEEVNMNDAISSVIEVKKEIKKDVKEKAVKSNKKEDNISKEQIKEINTMKKDIDSKIKQLLKEQEKLNKLIDKIKK